MNRPPLVASCAPGALLLPVERVAGVGPVWLWMSMTGYLAFGTSVSFATSVLRGR